MTWGEECGVAGRRSWGSRGPIAPVDHHSDLLLGQQEVTQQALHDQQVPIACSVYTSPELPKAAVRVKSGTLTTTWSSRVMGDFRIALRRLARRPVRTIATVTTLAIAVGTTTAAFAAIDGVLWRDLPVKRQDELVVAWRASERTSLEMPYDGAAFDVLARGAKSLSAVAGYSAWGSLPVLVETSKDSYALNGSYVAGDFFGVLGARPERGRLLTAADDQPGASPVAVLSDVVWKTRYGADAGLVGSTLMVAGQAVTIVGVAPKGLDYPRGTDIWYPLRADYATASAARPAPELHLLGRMTPGADPTTVAADITTTLAADARTAVFMADARSVVRGFADQVFGSVEPVLHAAFVAALLLLLAAAANATLSLLISGGRAAHELAVRAALGAERTNLVSQLIADATIVGLLAGLLGIGLAWLGLSVLMPLAPTELTRFGPATVGGRAVVFAVLASSLLALATGATAGLLLTRGDLRAVLWSGSRGSVSGRAAFRRTVAAVEMALAVVSATGAGLLIRTVVALDSLDPGYSAHDMTAVSLWTPYAWFDVPDHYLSSIADVVRDLESRPGIIAARPTLGPPLQQRLEVRLRETGQTDEQSRANPFVAVDAVLPGHFRSMGIAIRSGGGFTESDNRPDANPVVVVDEVLANAIWPGANPIGKLIVGYPGKGDTSFTVVGVVAATRYRELLNAHPRAYFPLRFLENSPPAALLVRTESASVPVRSLVAEAFAAADPQVRVLSARRMTDVLREPTIGRRFAMVVLVSFAGATLLLALLGVYSIFTVLVQERSREIGVRRALGAQRARLIRMVLAGVLAVVAIGGASGILAALWATRLLRSLLYNVASTDAPTLAAVVAVCLLLALAAGMIPAWRASSVDPAISLRSD